MLSFIENEFKVLPAIILHFNCSVFLVVSEEPLAPVIVPIVPVSAVVIVIVGKATPPFIIGLELDKLPPRNICADSTEPGPTIIQPIVNSLIFTVSLKTKLPLVGFVIKL